MTADSQMTASYLVDEETKQAVKPGKEQKESRVEKHHSTNFAKSDVEMEDL